MKILHIGLGLSLYGGTESVIVNLANEMSKSNDVTVCSLLKPSKDGPYFTRFNSSVKRHNLGITKEDGALKSLWKVFVYLKDVDVEIVHIHGFFYYFVLPILLLQKKKFVYTVHSDAEKESSKWDKRIHYLKKFCFKYHLLFPITISNESQRSFREYYHLDSRRINNAIAPSPITDRCPIIEHVRITKDTKVFFHPARISSEKNQLVLCKVFQRLINEGYDTVLLIAGSIEEEDVFDKISPYFCDRILYMGERHDIPKILSCADGFCLPSIWEGLPMTLLEALAVGCIPICSPVGGIMDIIENGVNGWLSLSSSEEDYYNVMKKCLVMSGNEIKEMKHKCIQSFAPYGITNAVKEHIDFYEKIIKGTKC